MTKTTVNTKNNQKEMTIMDCLKTLDKKQLNKIYKEFDVNSQEQLTGSEKESKIIMSILSNFLIHSIVLTDQEIKELLDLVNNKSIKNISDNLLKNYFVFKINDELIIPDEIKECCKNLENKEYQDERKKFVITSYLQINGILEIDKLISLAKVSGVKINKKEVNYFLKDLNFEVKDNKIYYNELASMIDENSDFLTYKNSNDYKKMTLAEMLAVNTKIELHNYEEKIANILSPLIKNKEKLNFTVSLIYDMINAGGNFEENIDLVLKVNKIKINKTIEKKLYKLIEVIYQNTTSWELNGYYPYELYEEYEEDIEYDTNKVKDIFNFFDEELDLDDECSCGCCNHESFESMKLEDQKDLYLNFYMMINGVLPIEKILDILKNEHNYKITKKEIINIVQSNEELDIKNNIICYKGFNDEEISMLINLKNMQKSYYIIKNVDDFLDEYDYNFEKLTDICLKYNMDNTVISVIQNAMNMCNFEKIILEEILNEFGIKLSINHFKNLLKELKNIQKNLRIWIFNGYTPSEILTNYNINKK